MAFGFGTNNGAGTSDLLSCASLAGASQRTYSFWMYRQAANVNGRALDRGPYEYIYEHASAAGLTYQRSFSTTNGIWESSDRPLQTWAHWLLTYDSSSTANDPSMYYNGALDTGVTEYSTPSGTATSGSASVYIGNRADLGRIFDGRFCEYAIWDRILSAGEIAALASGHAPAFFPVGRIMYLPMTRAAADLDNGSASYSNGAVQAHPRVIYPSAKILRFPPRITGGVTLVIQDAVLAIAADALNLTQSATLTVADTLQSLSAESPALSQANVLAVADVLQSITAENVALSQAIALTVADAEHSVVVDSVALSQAAALAVQDATLALAVDSPALTQANVLAVADAVLAIAADAPTLSTDNVLAVADALQSISVDAPELTQAHVLAVADTVQAITVDSPVLSESVILAVQDAVQALAVDSPALTQANILAVADAVMALSAGGVELTQSSTLVVSDALFEVLVDSFALQGLGESRQLYFVVEARDRVIVVAPRSRGLVAARRDRRVVLDPGKFTKH